MTNNQYGAKVYPYEATECKFLLGGIGTGNVSVGTRGNYCDWEIFGQPGIPESLAFRGIKGVNASNSTERGSLLSSNATLTKG